MHRSDHLQLNGLHRMMCWLRSDCGRPWQRRNISLFLPLQPQLKIRLRQARVHLKERLLQRFFESFLWVFL